MFECLSIRMAPMPQLTDSLGHGPHGAECTPGPGLEKRHDDQADQQRGQHQAVKAKAELRGPIRDHAGRIGPPPRDTERPEKFDRLPQVGRSGAHQPGLKQHIPEHGEKENQKAVPEPLGIHPGGRRPVAGAFEIATQLHAQLSASAQVVAEPFVATEYRKSQGQQKIDHPQPGKQDIEEAKGKIENRPNPEIVVPLLFHLHPATALSANAMQSAGQAFAHRPQPTQMAVSISAQHPFLMEAACFGHTDAQVPQATQTALLTFANRLLLLFLLLSDKVPNTAFPFVALFYQKEGAAYVIRSHSGKPPPKFF